MARNQSRNTAGTGDRLTGWLKMAGPSGSLWLTTSPAGQPRAGCPGPQPGSCWRSSGRKNSKVRDIELAPACRAAAGLGMRAPRNISIRICRTLNIKAILPEFQLLNRLKTLEKLHTQQYVFCGEEALLELMGLYFQLCSFPKIYTIICGLHSCFQL